MALNPTITEFSEILVDISVILEAQWHQGLFCYWSNLLLVTRVGIKITHKKSSIPVQKSMLNIALSSAVDLWSCSVLFLFYPPLLNQSPHLCLICSIHSSDNSLSMGHVSLQFFYFHIKNLAQKLEAHQYNYNQSGFPKTYFYALFF